MSGIPGSNSMSVKEFFERRAENAEFPSDWNHKSHNYKENSEILYNMRFCRCKPSNFSPSNHSTHEIHTMINSCKPTYDFDTKKWLRDNKIFSSQSDDP